MKFIQAMLVMAALAVVPACATDTYALGHLPWDALLDNQTEAPQAPLAAPHKPKVTPPPQGHPVAKASPAPALACPAPIVRTIEVPGPTVVKEVHHSWYEGLENYLWGAGYALIAIALLILGWFGLNVYRGYKAA